MAGIPVKYGKCVPAKYSVQVPVSTVPLKNKFQCLQNLRHSQNDVIHNENHVCISVNEQSVNSVPSARFNDINGVEQHLEECKPLPSRSDDMSQPLLAVQAKSLFKGNKNKTGFLDRESIGMEERENDIPPTPQREIGDIKTCDAMANDQSDKFTYGTSDMYKQPHLAFSKNSILAGNKNKNGSLEGSELHVRNQSKNCCLGNFNTTAGACDKVITDNSNLVLDQNYDHNILSTIECDLITTHDQKNLINAVNSEPHKFGFCPLTPLKIYKDEPVYWEVCPTDLEAHSLIKATGKSNYLAARIQVVSQLNIDKCRSHLSEYWDVQLLDLLKYGFPLDVDRSTLLTSTETNHTSALQNSHHVKSYIQEELSFQAMLGPFQAKPIPLHVSPLMVRDKQDSLKKGPSWILVGPRVPQ